MQEVARKRAFGIGLRARFPLLAKIAAIVLLCSGIALVSISYYKLRNTRWKSKPGTPELSKNITGVIEGFERRVTKNDRLYLLVKASRDITYSDSHHELEDVSVAVYPDVGEVPDQISANRAVYMPDSSVITFQGNVKIDTKESLRVNTETLVFDQNNKISRTDAPLTFEKETIKGTSVGAVVDQNTKRLDLKNSVAITVTPKSEPQSKTPGSPATHGSPLAPDPAVAPRRATWDPPVGQDFSPARHFATSRQSRPAWPRASTSAASAATSSSAARRPASSSDVGRSSSASAGIR